MKSSHLFLPLIPLLAFHATAAEAPPAKALKYHQALLKRPSNDTLFDRFFGAWLDEQPLDTLEAFLTARAAENAGADLSILASYQLRRGQEDQALLTLGKAIAALPHEPSLSMERARILLRRLDFKAARLDLANAAAGNDPAISLEASKLTGKSFLREGDAESAIKTWDTLLAAHPGDEDLLEDLVESAAAEGEIDQALTYVEKLIASGSDPYKKTLRQLRRGDLLAQAGKTDEALASYSATLAQVGEGSWLEREVLAQIDKIFRKQDRLDTLKDTLAKLAEENPRRLLIHLQLAKLEAAQGQTDAAVGRFREVLKRSPGDRQLREEFVRLLTDAQKYDEAAEELLKLIEQAPEDPGLHLQMADLRHRQENKDQTLAALENAHQLLGADETSGIRIASLMFQYHLNENGEKLLKNLTTAENATPAPSEALASEYARTNRKPEALAILQNIAASDQLDVVLRAAASISALGESETTLTILSGKSETFSTEPRFLAALAQSALAAGKADAALPPAIKLVRLSQQTSELAENIGLALRSIAAAEKTIEWRETLSKQENRTPSETCLLAALADSEGDFPAVADLMEKATAPMLIRFYAALLDQRGDFPEAIATLSRLADTEEGRKTSFFREMADLQRRAGLTEDALATVERWKQSAPGDKAAWVTASSLLSEAGRPEEAVKMTRQAVARFEGDTDLAASLASLHQEAGQMQDAEAIYWRLYDDSQSPSDQGRWAAQLANLALLTGRTDELADKLAERARANRSSIGPILAQAELARVMENEDKRRDLLLEAVRLQPKDTDLRLQIANLEEQSGNPDRVIAILEEASEADPTGRIRSALAQAYLRQGQVMKGMREMRALAGRQGEDPRSIEQSAASLAASGLYEEAIRFLRESIPNGGDWRSRYLLAIMLEQDGRETEAIPLFQALLQATGELPGKTIPTPQNNHSGWDAYGEDVTRIIQLTAAIQSAYAHRLENNGSTGLGSQVGPFILPDDAETVRNLSRIHLSKLGVKGIENSAFINDLTNSTTHRNQNYSELLAKYPDQPGLFEIAVLYAGWNYGGNPIEKPLIRKVLSERKNLSTDTIFTANLILLEGAEEADPAWDALLAATAEMIASEESEQTLQCGYLLLSFISGNEKSIPESRHKAISALLLEIAASDTTKDAPYRENFRLAAVRAAGEAPQLIETINREITDFRAESKTGNNRGINIQLQLQLAYYRHNAAYNPWMNRETPFKLPTPDDLNFSSIPAEIIWMIRSPQDEQYDPSSSIDPAELAKHLPSLSSPFLRAWIALRAGDDAALEKALTTAPPEAEAAAEAADFKTLTAFQALQKKDYPAAYRLFAETRPSFSSDRHLTAWLNFTLIAIASEMEADARSEFSEEIRAMLIQSRQALGTAGLPLLAAQAEILGLTELAERFKPRTIANTPSKPMGAATFGTRGSSSSRSSGNATIEKLKKFSSEGKTEAAAIEALNLIRKATTSGRRSHYEINKIKENTNKEVLAELFKMIAPGETKSLTKLMEYADICAAFGKPEEALTLLRRLHSERPADATIAGKLAFLLPPAERDFASKLISTAASDPDFVHIVSSSADALSEEENDARTNAYFETVTQWLEKADPSALKSTNLTWVTYYGKNFFESDYSRSLPNLLSTISKDDQSRKGYEEYASLAKRLALAMLRHPSTTEEGFRLLSASKAWEIPAVEMDSHARSLLLREPDTSGQFHRADFFYLRYRNGGSSSGDDLAEHSSIRWLTSRLSEAKSPSEILPEAYLAELTTANPKTGAWVTALATLKDIESVEKLFASDTLDEASGPFASMLREGVLSRAGTLPGASKFFLEKLTEIKPGSVSSHRYNPGAEKTFATLKAALTTAGSAEKGDLDAICKAISLSIFGEKIDFANAGNGHQLHSAIDTMESVVGTAHLSPAATARVYTALYRLRIPVAGDTYAMREIFQKITIPKNPAGEALFASMGLLEDTADWEPFAAIIASADYNGNAISFSPKDLLLLPEMQSYMQWEAYPSPMAKRLESRKPKTFGALITAASITKGAERSRLTAAAFSHAAPQLAKMSPERLAAFTPFTAWLPADSLANLPASLRKKLDHAGGEQLGKLLQAADKYLTTEPTAPSPYDNPFDEIEELVQNLAPLDLDKAVEVFLEADNRYTTSLAHGGRFSDRTLYDMQVSMRDAAISALIYDSDSPMAKDPVLGLRFMKAATENPDHTTFTLCASNGSALIAYIGRRIYLGTGGKDRPYTQDKGWIAAMNAAAAFPPDLKKEALACLVAHNVRFDGVRDAVSVPYHRRELAAMEDLDPLVREYRELIIGTCELEKDTPKEQEKTVSILLKVITDEEISPQIRLQLALSVLSMTKNPLENKAFASAFADLYEDYAVGDRSTVHNLAMAFTISSALIEDITTSREELARITRIFWQNADAPKRGGHSPIPPRNFASIYTATVRAGETQRADKMLAQFGGELKGNLRIITAFIMSGDFEAAEKLLPPPGSAYSIQHYMMPTQTPRFEKQLAAFSKRDIDAHTLMRLHAQLLLARPDYRTPTVYENSAARARDLLASYRANTPENIDLKREILLAIAFSDHTLALELHDSLNAASTGINYSEEMDTFTSRADELIKIPKDAFPADIRRSLFTATALVNFQKGDTAMLSTVIKNMTQRSNRSNRSSTILYNTNEELLRSLCFYTIILINEGNDKPLRKIYPLVANFTVKFADKVAANSHSTWLGGYWCHLVSLQLREPKRFAFFEELQVKHRNISNFSYISGLHSTAYSCQRSPMWRRPDFLPVRRAFIEKFVTDRRFAKFFRTNRYHPEGTAEYGLRDELLALTENPPKGISLNFLARLVTFRIDEDLKAGKQEQGIRLLRDSLKANPNSKEWSASRYGWKIRLTQQLISTGEIKEAKTTFDSILKTEIPKPKNKAKAQAQTKEYADLKKQLAAALKK